MNKLFISFCFFCLLHIKSLAQQHALVLKQFTFIDTAGNKFNLDSLKGKTVFVDCWFPACPPCREEMPYSQLLQQRLAALQLDSNLVFITICFKQTMAEWKQALQTLHMPKAIHLYSPASTYEIPLSGGNFPTYRIFNSHGLLDIQFTPRPSELQKIDFILYASLKGEKVMNAIYAYEAESKKPITQIKHPLLKSFLQLEAPMHQKFAQAWLALSQSK